MSDIFSYYSCSVVIKNESELFETLDYVSYNEWNNGLTAKYIQKWNFKRLFMEHQFRQYQKISRIMNECVFCSK